MVEQKFGRRTHFPIKRLYLKLPLFRFVYLLYPFMKKKFKKKLSNRFPEMEVPIYVWTELGWQMDSALLSKLAIYHFYVLLVPYHQSKSPKKFSNSSLNVLLGCFRLKIFGKHLIYSVRGFYENVTHDRFVY